MAGIPFPDDNFKKSLRDSFYWAEEFGCELDSDYPTSCRLINSRFADYGSTSLQSVEEGLARNPRTFAEFVKATDWSQVLN